nr:hypothetical protein [uncultured Haemophilus sp.]
MASRQAVLNTGEINSQQGIIRAKDLMIDTQKQHINNQEGEISAKVATITAQRIDNQSGEINANRAEITTSQLDNRAGKINAEQITLSSQQVDNQAGKINASAVTMVAKRVNNQAGIIKANDAVITADTLNNRAVSENGSLVSANNLTLNLAELDNQGTKANGEVPTQGIQAKQFTLNAKQLANQQGGIYSSENVTLNVAERVDNQQGELLALNKIAIQNQDKLMLNNQEGMIQGHQQVNLDLKGIEAEGTIKTAGDLSVNLKESFTLNKAFEVGNNLTFKTEGDFVNNAVQAVGNSATFTAAHIANQANAEISGANTTLNAQSITNRGLIDGGKVLLNSSTVTNIGTGRIYGDHLAFKGKVVENLAETVDGETKAGTIAARERLDFGVEKLSNQDHALILSLGDMAIGGSLDENERATGKAAFVDNGSATIEVLGNGSLQVY